MRLAPLLLLALALLASGCAHRDPARLNDAWRAMPLDWPTAMAVHGVRSLDEIEGVDYCAGVSVIRLRQKGLLRFFPLGTWAREVHGTIASRKEWLASSALAPDAAGWAFVAAAGAGGLIVIMPAFQFSEEVWHAYGETLRAEGWALSIRLRQAMVLWGAVPILSPALEYATYYLDPREIHAKALKWLFLGTCPNLDCPAARERWESLLAWLGWHRASERARAAGLDYVPPAWIAAEAEALRGAEIVPDGDYWHPAFWPQALGPAGAPDGPTTLPRIWN